MTKQEKIDALLIHLTDNNKLCDLIRHVISGAINSAEESKIDEFLAIFEE